MPAQINSDSKVVWCKMGHLCVPVAERTAEAMDEHDRRAAFACDDVVDQRYLRPRGIDDGDGLSRCA